MIALLTKRLLVAGDRIKTSRIFTIFFFIIYALCYASFVACHKFAIRDDLYLLIWDAVRWCNPVEDFLGRV